jgi:hypothetical protein
MGAAERQEIEPDLTPEDVARICNVTPRCVRNWAYKGKIDGAAFIGGVWRFDAAKFWEWRRSKQAEKHFPEEEARSWGSTRGAKSGGSGSRVRGRKSDNRLERLLGLQR